MMKRLGRIGTTAAAGILSAVLLAGVATAANAQTPSGTGPEPVTPGAASATPASSTPSNTPTTTAVPTSPRPGANEAAPDAVGAPRDFLEDWFAFKNNTPYTWYLDQANTNVQWWNGTGWDNADWKSPGVPPATIAPGATAVFEAVPGTSMNVMYDFTDAAGHRLAFQGNNDRFDHAQTWTKIDTAVAGEKPAWQESTQFETASRVPGVDQTFQATMVTTTVIDAAKDPAAAIAALAKSNGDASQQSFTVQKDASGKPEVTETMGEHERTSAIVVNRSSEPASIDGTSSTTHQEATTLTESLSYENSVSIMEVVNVGIRASFDSSQAWTQSRTTANGETVTIPSDNVGWKTQAQSTTEATGTFAFQGSDGINYVLTNEKVDEPGLAYLDPHTGTTRPGTDFSSFVGPCASNGQFCPAGPSGSSH